MPIPQEYLWGIVVFALIATEIAVALEQRARLRLQRTVRREPGGYIPPNI
jgi:hypothetical protein